VVASPNHAGQVDHVERCAIQRGHSVDIPKVSIGIRRLHFDLLRGAKATSRFTKGGLMPQVIQFIQFLIRFTWIRMSYLLLSSGCCKKTVLATGRCLDSIGDSICSYGLSYRASYTISSSVSSASSIVLQKNPHEQELMKLVTTCRNEHISYVIETADVS
jgi:hypothetical protein